MRALSFSLGLLTLAAAWLGWFHALLPGPFSAHMTAHMAVVAVAAPLCALGIAGTAFDPVPRAPRFFAPVPASIVELVLVWAWHTPGLHHAARNVPLAFAAEQASFAGAGLWLWLAALGGARGTPGTSPDRAGAGILGLLLTSMHMTLLGALLALPPRVLYGGADGHGGHGPHAEHRGHEAHGAHAHGASPAAPRATIGALEDQHLGGAIMIVLGGASYLVGGLWLSVGLVRGRLAARSGAPGALAAAPVSPALRASRRDHA